MTDEVFVPGRAATPADAVFGFGAWLTTSTRVSGPFSQRHDAAPMAELAGEFCRVNGWNVGPNYPQTFTMPADGCSTCGDQRYIGDGGYVECPTCGPHAAKVDSR